MAEEVRLLPRLEGVSKTYGSGVRAVDGLDLQVQPGGDIWFLRTKWSREKHYHQNDSWDPNSLTKVPSKLMELMRLSSL